MNLPPDIKEIFFETISEARTPLEFEQWLYNDKTLESILPPEDYLDLISLGYNDKTVKYELFNLLEKHIDKAEYEKWRLIKLLHKVLQKDPNMPEILMMFYDLYCRGYDFLDNLGIGYGLHVEAPREAESWEELSPEQQQNLLNSFYPAIELEIKKVISWLETGKVIPTTRQLTYNQLEYIDNRTEVEKQPTAYNRVQ